MHVAKGGLDWSASKVGTVASITGIVMIPYQIFVIPQLAASLGVRKLIVCAAALQIPFVFAMPFLRAPTVGVSAYSENTLEIMTLLFRATQGLLGTTAFTAVFLLINNACQIHQRASVNGLSMAVASITKAVGPIAGSELFAWSIFQANYTQTSPSNVTALINHHFAFDVNCLLWLFLTAIAFFSIPKRLE